MATRAETYGFWPGFFTGLVLAAALGVGLAYLYPPRPLLPPELAPGSLQAPAAPGLPAGAGEPEAPRSEGLLPAPPPAPLINGLPAPDAAPKAPDGTTGSPSLVPPSGGGAGISQ